jgi:hypothetical protein
MNGSIYKPHPVGTDSSPMAVKYPVVPTAKRGKKETKKIQECDKSHAPPSLMCMSFAQKTLQVVHKSTKGKPASRRLLMLRERRTSTQATSNESAQAAVPRVSALLLEPLHLAHGAEATAAARHFPTDAFVHVSRVHSRRIDTFHGQVLSR